MHERAVGDEGDGDGDVEQGKSIEDEAAGFVRAGLLFSD